MSYEEENTCLNKTSQHSGRQSRAPTPLLSLSLPAFCIRHGEGEGAKDDGRGIVEVAGPADAHRVMHVLAATRVHPAHVFAQIRRHFHLPAASLHASLSLTHARTHKHTHTLSLSLSLSLRHLHARTHARTHAHTHTHTHTHSHLHACKHVSSAHDAAPSTLSASAKTPFFARCSCGGGGGGPRGLRPQGPEGWRSSQSWRPPSRLSALSSCAPPFPASPPRLLPPSLPASLVSPCASQCSAQMLERKL